MCADQVHAPSMGTYCAGLLVCVLSRHVGGRMLPPRCKLPQLGSKGPSGPWPTVMEVTGMRVPSSLGPSPQG